MNPNSPRTASGIGNDALNVWMDFWELTGRLRVDILRSSGSGGYPSKMIPPDASTTRISGAPAVMVGKDIEPVTDRPGEIYSGIVTLEMIDHIYREDRLVINIVEHEIISVTEKDFGNFSIWTVKARRID